MKSEASVLLQDQGQGQGHKNIVLIGMMGSGKTTLAKLLSEEAPFALVDTDALIEEATQKTISQLFAAVGESGFRVIESEILETICKPGGRVISTGGGIVLKSSNMELLKKNGFVVYLKVEPEALTERLLAKTANRPLLTAQGEPAEALLEKLNRLVMERGALYERYADFTLENNDISMKAAVDLILGSYNNSFGPA